MKDINPLELAKGISDFGIMAVICAFFLIAFIYLFRRFIKSYDDIFENFKKQQAVIAEILTNNMEQLSLIKNIQDNIGDQQLSQVTILANYAFNDAKSEVQRAVERIIRENHIDNRPAVERKIQIILENLHGNRNRNFESFSYKGKNLSLYTNYEWIERIANIMVDEVYSKEHNYSRLATNLNLAYEEIKVEFYKNLSK